MAINHIFFYCLRLPWTGSHSILFVCVPIVKNLVGNSHLSYYSNYSYLYIDRVLYYPFSILIIIIG
jgi:hypothetical protein